MHDEKKPPALSCKAVERTMLVPKCGHAINSIAEY